MEVSDGDSDSLSSDEEGRGNGADGGNGEQISEATVDALTGKIKDLEKQLNDMKSQHEREMKELIKSMTSGGEAKKTEFDLQVEKAVKNINKWR
ncbi:MAG: hypothetical protein LUD47_06030 [Clostridia bacterium]|nr:hypothetical protein [Clostridia bacterium]